MSELANRLLALVTAMLIPLYTSSPGRVIASSQEEFAPPDIWSWSFNDGTLGWPANGLSEFDFWNFYAPPFSPQPSTIVADATFPANIEATGYSARHEYVIGAEEIGNIDRNRSVELFPVNMGDSIPGADTLEHFFFRQWVKIGTPFDTGIDVQRKLFYIRSDQDINATWCIFLKGQGIDASGASLLFNYADTSNGISENLLIPGGHVIPWETWRGTEVEVQVNTPGVSNGRVQLWTYGTDGSVLKNAEWTGLNMRGSSTKKLELIQSGNQVNRINTGEVVNEIRNVTRLALSTQRMGP